MPLLTISSVSPVCFQSLVLTKLDENKQCIHLWLSNFYQHGRDSKEDVIQVNVVESAGASHSFKNKSKILPLCQHQQLLTSCAVFTNIKRQNKGQ